MLVEGFQHMLAQIQFENPGFWFGIFFVSGLVSVLIVVIITEAIIRSHRRRLTRQAKDAGVSVTFPKRSSADPFAIEGCGYCLLFIIIMILASVGISLPLIIVQLPEILVVSVVLVVFGALWWSLVIASIPLTRRDYRKQQRAFDTAIQIQKESNSTS